jgi:hypothetical protein
MVTGRIIAESLRPGADLEVPGLRLVRVGRYDVAGSAVAGQPSVWTFLDVEGPPELFDAVAALLGAPGWYADFRDGTDRVVVFPGRAFRYREGDPDGRAAAQEYGRAAGVPEHQLDWDG